MNDIIQVLSKQEKKKKHGLKPGIKITLSFMGLIAVGSVLLCMPFCNQTGQFSSYVDSLFSATSAVCVTGLTSINVAQTYTFWGQLVLVLLIQAGGLGFMTLASMLLIAVGKKITLKDRLTLQEMYNQNQLSGLVRLTRNIIFLTLCIESCGAILLLFVFVPMYGGIGVWYSIFHAVSAFCNAGFDLLGDSLRTNGLTVNVIANLSIMSLIFLGGLGFAVILDVLKLKKGRRLLEHSKIVLLMSGIMIGTSALAFLLLEYNNNETMGQLSFGGKILASLFQAVTPRTAGYYSIDQSALRPASKLLTMANMMVGASPGSAGGGIKTSTVAVLLLALVNGARTPDKEAVVFSKRIPQRLINRSVAIFMYSLITVLLFTFLVSIFEMNNPAAQGEAVMFECISAYATVGLSCNLTPTLCIASKLAIVLLMLLGRLGSVVFTLLFLKPTEAEARIQYPDIKISIG